MWILLSVFAAAGMCIGIGCWLRVFCRTAWIVVHPWNLGCTAAEIELTLQKLPSRIRGDRKRQEAFVLRHLEYYQRLESGLRWANARWIIVCDEPHVIERSCEFIYGLTALPWPAAIVERFGRLRHVVEVATKCGRATPHDTDWETIFTAFSKAGVRRIFVVGSYLGERNGCLVRPEDTYFCVNYVIQQGQACKRFHSVVPLPDLCYVHEVPANQEPLTRQSLGFRTRKQTRNDRKKKR